MFRKGILVTPILPLAIALFPVAFSACGSSQMLAGGYSTPQTVRFEEPVGGYISFNGAPEMLIPMSTEIYIGQDHSVVITFPDETLRGYGFTEDDFQEMRQHDVWRVEGTLRIEDTSYIQPVFRITPEQVHAVMVGNSTVFWRFRDEADDLVLDFVGFPPR